MGCFKQVAFDSFLYRYYKVADRTQHFTTYYISSFSFIRCIQYCRLYAAQLPDSSLHPA